MFERERAADFGCRPAELATASAAARDFNYAERRTMPHHRDLFDSRLSIFRQLDDSRQGRITGHDAPEKISKHSLDLAVDQIIDLKFIHTACSFELPRTRAAHNELGFVLFNDRVLDDAK